VRNHQSGANARDTQDQEKHNSLPVATVPSQTNHPSSEGGQTERDEKGYKRDIKNSDWHGTFGLIINGMLALFAGATLRQIWLQTKANQVSAEAARMSAEALIAAERGWLLLTPTDWNHKLRTFGPAMKTQFQKFPIAIKNVGKTPVRIKAFSMRYVVLDNLSELPDTPNYSAPKLYDGFLLVPQDSYAETVVLEGYEATQLGDLAQSLEFGKKHLYAYGYVQYVDDFNRDRETRAGFAYEYFWVSGALHPNLTKRQAGPPAYNRAT
jgi:hypothetical protein